MRPQPAVFGRDGARTRATPLQYLCAATVLIGLGVASVMGPASVLTAAHWMFRVGFGVAIALRLYAVTRSRRFAPPPPALPRSLLPTYTIILPLYREAAVVDGLVRALDRLDYPRDRREIVFALEADDDATRAAAARHLRPGVRIVVPAGGPRTKPNACNAALAVATGEFVVVYDAEDRPDPGQLREAATRFAAEGDGLVCLQAPLRVGRAGDWLRRQFALEYAALFEVMLPALAALGLPFPLGGSSNHFRRAALAAVGGWDAHNVTEDADIGLKLGACGGRLGLLASPTWEPAPPSLAIWTPQRTRWVKGHLHTWIVHMRRPWRGGWRSFCALQVTLGLNVASAALHGPLTFGVAACLLVAAATPGAPAIPAADIALLLAGWIVAAACMAKGARRAGVPCGVRDLLLAPVYWPLQSLAAVFAVVELVLRPHHWNKTPHEVQTDEAVTLREAAATV